MYGLGKTQTQFLDEDQCLVVDEHDVVINHASKRLVHTFNFTQPRGICHRAFSLFVFDTDNRLLLQRRALSKITFPGVWTNTCCSHPLAHQVPSEETEGDGVKHAAIRKLQHELGVTLPTLTLDRMVHMGRIHYWAKDTETHGPDSPWGEHEVDHLLIVRLRPDECPLNLAPHADEVVDAQWVSASELDAWLKDPSLTWSPWFCAIYETFLKSWWTNLDQVAPLTEIHSFGDLTPVANQKVGRSGSR